MNKTQALAKFLDISINSGLKKSSYDESIFELGSQEYMVLTDREANKRVKESILETLWAFRASFLSSHMSDLDESQIAKMQESMSEDCNSVFKKLIKDLDHFVNDAVSSDGRGHFLSGYDGEENVEGKFFIYRTN